MNRKRALISDTFKVKKRRIFTEKFGATNNNGKKEIGSLKLHFHFSLLLCWLMFVLDGPMDIKSTLLDLMTLFPRKIFNDTLPQIVLKHQLYSIHDDKTRVDRQLVILRSPSPPHPQPESFVTLKILNNFIFILLIFFYRANFGKMESFWCFSWALTLMHSDLCSLRTIKPKFWHHKRAKKHKERLRGSSRECCLPVRIWASTKTRCWKSSSSQTLR